MVKTMDELRELRARKLFEEAHRKTVTLHPNNPKVVTMTWETMDEIAKDYWRDRV